MNNRPFEVVDPTVHKDILGRQVDLTAKKYPNTWLLLRPSVYPDYWVILVANSDHS